MPNQPVESALQSDANILAELIYMSGPDNLNSVFSGHLASLSFAQRKQICLDYLCHALSNADGQFGFKNQHIIRHGNTISGCVSYWVKPLSTTFRQVTLDSLLNHFSGLDCALILQNSQQLAHLVRTPDEQSLSIGHLAVRPEHRGRGLSKLLIDFCAHQARLLGKSQLILDLDANNDIALEAYRAVGFEPIGIMEPTPQGSKLGLSRHIHMRKSLFF